MLDSGVDLLLIGLFLDCNETAKKHGLSLGFEDDRKTGLFAFKDGMRVNSTGFNTVQELSVFMDGFNKGRDKTYA